MTTNVFETLGVIRADGTLELPQNLHLPPGPINVRLWPVAAPVATCGDWDAAMAAVENMDDYDFDAYQRQRDCDLQQSR